MRHHVMLLLAASLGGGVAPATAVPIGPGPPTKGDTLVFDNDASWRQIITPTQTGKIIGVDVWYVWIGDIEYYAAGFGFRDSFGNRSGTRLIEEFQGYTSDPDAPAIKVSFDYSDSNLFAVAGSPIVLGGSREGGTKFGAVRHAKDVTLSVTCYFDGCIHPTGEGFIPGNYPYGTTVDLAPFSIAMQFHIDTKVKVPEPVAALLLLVASIGVARTARRRGGPPQP